MKFDFSKVLCACMPGELLNANECFLFVWERLTFLAGNAQMKSKASYSAANVHKLHFVFHGVAAPFPPIFREINSCGNVLMEIASYDLHADKYQYQTKELSAAYGYQVFKGKTQIVHLKNKSNVFLCEDGYFISVHYLLDGFVHCLINKSDEHQWNCCKFNKEGCSQANLSHESFCEVSAIICSTTGHSTNISHFRTWLGTDKRSKIQHIKHKVDNVTKCEASGWLKCKSDETRFSLADLCTYRLSTDMLLLPCQFGDHLMSCTHFECSAKYKCPEHYCIPWHYVCNGHLDCPFGFDEQHCHQSYCSNMFKCSDVSLCLHPSLVCDGEGDCPVEDDELHCILFNAKCPESCHCLAYILKCESANDTVIVDSKIPFEFVFVHFTKLTNVNSFVACLPDARHIILNKVGISKICELYSESQMVQYVDNSENFVVLLSKDCIANLPLLQNINLDQNVITEIGSLAFRNLSSLTSINLSNNSITIICDHFLFKVSSAVRLTILENQERIFVSSQETLHLSFIEMLQTDDYTLCCLVHETTLCEDNRPWYKSCSSILPEKTMFVTFIVMSLSNLCLNFISVLLQIYFEKHDTSYGRTVVSINLTDLCWALYLSIMWISDQDLRDLFVLTEPQWLSGEICFLSFFLISFHSVLNPILLLLLAMSRLNVTLKPLESKFKVHAFATGIIKKSFSVVFLVCASTTAVSKHVLGSLPFSLCIPYVDPIGKYFLLKSLTCVFAAFQTGVCVAVLFAHVQLMFALNTGDVSLGRRQAKLTASVITQLTVLSLSNMVSWIPSNTIFLCSLFAPKFSTRLVIWTTALLLPSSSIVHPVVFFWATTRATQTKQKSQP